MINKSHLRLNLSYGAWKKIRQLYGPPSSSIFDIQMKVAGTLFSVLSHLQEKLLGKQIASLQIDSPIVIIGHWRSGTTFLHELLCLDATFCYPTTHACMNPHYFALSHGAVTPRDKIISRPMDGLPIGALSPQEDEFALLGLGAASPYEALLYPQGLPLALRRANPDDLSREDRTVWKKKFHSFLNSTAFVNGGKTPILKSPTHTYRVKIIREAFPKARFIHIVRNPYDVFGSTLKMWRQLFDLYACAEALTERGLIDAILDGRIYMEEVLYKDSQSLASDRFITVRYEDLVASPVETLEDIYRRMDLGSFESMSTPIHDCLNRKKGHKAEIYQLSDEIREEIKKKWGVIFSRYAYDL